VRQVARSQFAFAKGPSNQDKTNRHVLTTDQVGLEKGDMLLITGRRRARGVLQGAARNRGSAAAPVACFKAPHHIVAVRCHGATICVGCARGEVLFLRAPFLAA
jgi:hypothetical protein